jgi:hypothetical protein
MSIHIELRADRTSSVASEGAVRKVWSATVDDNTTTTTSIYFDVSMR